jgi:hypothetical protein
MRQLSARPAVTAYSSTLSFKTGRLPGWPVQTGQQCVFGSPPNWVVHVQKIFVFVDSSTWVSSPMTIS